MIPEAEFKAGDTVTLKTGGPLMTITDTNDMARIAFCKWFRGDTLEHANFPFLSLERATSETPAISEAEMPPMGSRVGLIVLAAILLVACTWGFVAWTFAPVAIGLIIMRFVECAIDWER